MNVVKKYECLNIVQVRKKIMELTNTEVMESNEKEYWRSVCYTIKRGKENNYDTVEYTGGDDQDYELWIGWDSEHKVYLVAVELIQ